ncbi:MAG: ATP-binding cassette domain-containing protein [Actinomycetaceae bacterium]|nr:ATP-binding cassette domain-containing protein [Actinomycetaceae bacterium]
MQPLIRCDNVSFIRGGNVILDGVSFEAHHGQHWAILGPNGAGKTTLISILAARQFPSSGHVELLGTSLGKVEIADLHAQIGLCSSSVLARIPHMETLEEVVLNASYGVLAGGKNQVFDDEDRQRANNLMNVFGVQHLAARPIVTLSDGERQRMMMCRALMADPEIMILDEPAAGVDLGAREELMAALSELAKDERSPMMLLVTHHVEEIPQAFTHAMLINHGRIAYAGEIEQVMTSQHLSDVFELPLQLGVDRGRYSAFAHL